MTLKYAIIGSGMMGQEHLRNLKLLDDVEVVAIAEPDEAMRRSAVEIVGREVADFATIGELVRHGGGDAFVVASPNHTHAEILAMLLPLGKPVLMEKPVVTTIRQAARLREAVARTTAPVWIAMEYRFTPGVSHLLADLQAGVAGELKMFSVVERRYPFLAKIGNWNRFNNLTGGTLVEKCCHFFDLMRLAVGSEPTRVSAIGGQALNHLDESYDGQVPDIIDNAYVTVSFANGVNAMLELCMFAEGASFQERVAATGTKALLEARIPRPGRFEIDGRNRSAEYVCAFREKRARTGSRSMLIPPMRRPAIIIVPPISSTHALPNSSGREAASRT